MLLFWVGGFCLFLFLDLFIFIFFRIGWLLFVFFWELLFGIICFGCVGVGGFFLINSFGCFLVIIFLRFWLVWGFVRMMVDFFLLLFLFDSFLICGVGICWILLYLFFWIFFVFFWWFLFGMLIGRELYGNSKFLWRILFLLLLIFGLILYMGLLLFLWLIIIWIWFF